MATYNGDRTIDGVQVVVDGQQLAERTDVRAFSPNGFEWSYEGAEPRQLALALLLHHLREVDPALALVEPFMRAVVANFGNEWEMTSEEIEAAIAALRKSGHCGTA
jgi:hypothetical protein